jgi:hypothetical protein
MAPRRDLIPVVAIGLAFVAGVALGGVGRAAAAFDPGLPALADVIPAAQRHLGVSTVAAVELPSGPAIAVPERSGDGRRVVVDPDAGRLWTVEADGAALSLPLTVAAGCLPAGTASVISSAPTAMLGPQRQVDWLVRISADGQGFHSAVTGAGCAALSEADAHTLYRWATPGTAVVVLG